MMMIIIKIVWIYLVLFWHFTLNQLFLYTTFTLVM